MVYLRRTPPQSPPQSDSPFTFLHSHVLKVTMSNDHPAPLSDEGYCARCDGMFSAAGFDKMRSIEGYFHSRKPDIDQAAKQGCPLCQKIVSELIRQCNSDRVALTFYVYSERMGDRAAWQAWRRAIWSARRGIEHGSGTRAPADRPESLIAIDGQLTNTSFEIGLLAEEGERSYLSRLQKLYR